MNKLEDVTNLVSQIENYRNTHRLEFYEPYGYQKKFHHAHGLGGGLAAQRALIAGNQVGKTFCGAMETAFHLTGLYPAWWEGYRFDKPVEWMVASTTNETTRDRCQREIFGEPTDDRSLGTGAVPKKFIGEPTRKPGVPNAYDSVLVKHVSGGWSKVYFRAYEQGAKKFMGYRIDGGWGDEEPPADVWSQMLRGTFATNGILFLTFTPEEGFTNVVHQFVNDLKMGQAVVHAEWDDAPHMTPEKQEQKLGAIPSHEREMRRRGVPMMGTGIVYPVNEDVLKTDPIVIPGHWARIFAVDFGWDHPAALVCLAWDRDTDVIYVYDVWKQSKALLEVHAQAIKSRGEWVPIAWPHDGMKHDPKSGKPMADLYRSMGCNMHFQPFSNPPSIGQKEGQGGNGVEVGVLEILSRMETGRFKVFSHLKDWFDEWRMYHRKDGEIVKLNDDLMDATRYAVQMRRHAMTQPVRAKPQQSYAGMSNWG